MSLSLQASLASTMMSLSKTEKAAASALIMLGTTYASKTAANTIDLMGLVKFLRGDGEPPQWLAKAGPYLRKFGQIPNMSKHVGVLASSLLQEKGIEESSFLSLLEKVSGGADLPIRTESVAVAADDLLTLVTKRLDESVDPDAPNMLVECPYCLEFFGAQI